MAVNLLDIGYYREANPDLAAAGLTTDEQLANHFFSSGIIENRLFSRFVDLNFYRASNSDLTLLDTSSLYSHLSNFGVQEGRRFSPFFDLGFYQRANTDLAAVGITTNEQLFNHFQSSGVNEDRRASSLVDLGFYKSANPDLAPFNNAQLLDHLRRNGIAEERRFSPVADLGIYEAANPDLKAANLSYSGLFQHLGTNGIFEGRRLSISYDPIFYVNAQNNPDLAASGLNSQQLLEHFELIGINEGRQASDSFNVNFYKTINSDLAVNGITTNQQALNHFEGIGFREERIPGNSPFVIPTGVEPGNVNNNLTTAANLGILSSRRNGTVSQQINSSDLSGNFLNDIYRILIPTTSDINIAISGANKALNLQIIYDRNGDYINLGGNTEEIFFSSSNSPFNRTLGAGTYYVRVFTSDQTTNTNYNLTFSAITVPMVPNNPDPGETPATALNLGTLSSNPVFLQNFVGAVDSSDIYRFSIAAPSTLNLSINNLNIVSNVDAPTLELYQDLNNNNQLDAGELITAPLVSSPLNLPIGLTAGTFFLRMRQNATFTAASNTRFSLNLSAT